MQLADFGMPLLGLACGGTVGGSSGVCMRAGQAEEGSRNSQRAMRLDGKRLTTRTLFGMKLKLEFASDDYSHRAPPILNRYI